MELIDKQKAKEFAYTFFGDPILKMAANALLDNAPTVEVVPGRWNKSRLFGSEVFWSGFGYSYTCSNCGRSVECDENDAFDYEYCPYCGKPMEDESNGRE